MKSFNRSSHTTLSTMSAKELKLAEKHRGHGRSALGLPPRGRLSDKDAAKLQRWLEANKLTPQEAPQLPDLKQPKQEHKQPVKRNMEPAQPQPVKKQKQSIEPASKPSVEQQEQLVRHISDVTESALAVRW